MRTLTISLMDSASAMRDMRQSATHAWKTGKYQGEALTYATPAQLFKVFTLQRWEIIACLQTQAKPVNLADLSRLLRVTPQYLQEDLEVLLAEGVIEQDTQGFSIPYVEIHTDFTLKKAA